MRAPPTARTARPAAPTASSLDALLETLGERLRQAALSDLGLGLLERILDTPVVGSAGVEIEEEVGGPRISVARLAD
jgi:hypothetical protein